LILIESPWLAHNRRVGPAGYVDVAFLHEIVLLLDFDHYLEQGDGEDGQHDEDKKEDHDYGQQESDVVICILFRGNSAIFNILDRRMSTCFSYLFSNFVEIVTSLGLESIGFSDAYTLGV
jgi:hypothetical protein